MTTEQDNGNIGISEAEMLMEQVYQRLHRLREIIRHKNARIAELEQRVRKAEQKTTIIRTKMAF